MDMNGHDMGGMMGPPPSSAMANGTMGGGGGHHMGGGGMMMMHMTFFWGHRVDILFSNWPGNRNGPGMYVLALLVVLALSALVELLSYLPRIAGGPTAGGLALTAISTVRTALSYVVMLAVMSFNVGVLVAAVLGHALGFFLFGSGLVFAPKQTRLHQEEQVIPHKC